ncbi:MAG TPA: GC-type dockerin domain-anchored protein, partial [Phycisphaerales bacterium]|nr:GC-type dockerin domain-anchored protein [Phycisphaerales bacterium]
MKATLAAAVCLSATLATGQDCSKTSVGLVPLNDLGAGEYLGEQGGLYPGGVNVRPMGHQIDGRQLSQQVTPRNGAGQPDPSGWIGLISIGMSNTSNEFQEFVPLVQQFPNRNPRLRVVNGAQGGRDAVDIADRDSTYWQVALDRVAAAGMTRHQVQAVWLKQAIANPGNRFPDDEFPEDAQRLEGLLADIARNIRFYFPNARLCYVSTRIYAGYATTQLNPEPYAYQSGFAGKWLIERQIGGDPTLSFVPQNGEPPAAPWLAWGPYPWADGLTPRSDGLIWRCEDFANDGTHPSVQGARKVAHMLLGHFSGDSTARRWFVACPADFNDDGALNSLDALMFFNAIGAGHPRADFNADGSVTSQDVLAFLNAYTAG